MEYGDAIKLLEKSGEKFEFRCRGASICRASTSAT